MKSTLPFVLVLLLSASLAKPVAAQTPPVIHNTWTSGAAMPTGMLAPQVAVLENEIYVVGGFSSGAASADTQIYNPVTNVWSTGAPLPAAISNGGAAVVKNILYVIGGSPDSGPFSTNAVWAYSPKTKTWTAKADMPTPRYDLGVVVVNKIIYAIGGIGGLNNGNNRLNNVESYNPATNTWTEENPLLIDKEAVSVGVIGTTLTGFTIVVADGYVNSDNDSGDNEGYDAVTNTWTSLTSDPEPRSFACAGAIGTRLYAAGGWVGNGDGPALTTVESFLLSKQSWKSLASIPQGTLGAGSAVYKGKLYCFGGSASFSVGSINNVQIYQP